MRRYRSALILLLILAVMSGGYYFYNYIWPTLNAGAVEEEDPTASAASAASTSINIVDRKSDELAELTVRYLSEEYVLHKDKVMEKSAGSSTEREVTRWSLTNRNDFPVDSSKLSTAATNFCIITSSKIVEEYASDLSQYGFGSPGAATAVGTFEDGTEVSIEIGDKNPTNDAYYVRRDGGNTVYLGSTYSSEKIMIQKSEIAYLSLFDIEEPDVARFEMTRGGAPLFNAYNRGDYVWELESPVIAPLNGTAQGMILESLRGVSAMEYVAIGAGPEELAQYGLDSPKYTILIELSEGSEVSVGTGDGVGSVELLIGSEKAVRSSVYAMMGGTNDVFVLSLANFGYLDKPIKEFVDAFAYIVNINQVDHIRADFDGQSIMIDIFAEMGSTEDDQFFIDGMDVTDLTNEKDRSLFRLFYQALIGVTIYDLETDATPEGEAEITFLYELKEEPHTMLVEFVPKDERLYYVFRNDVYAGIIVEKRLFDKPEEGLRPMYAQIKEAMEAASAAVAA